MSEKKKKKRVWLWVILSIFFVLIIIFCGIFLLYSLMRGVLGYIPMGESIALIRIEGVISDSESTSLLFGAGTEPEKIIDQLHKAEENTNVKAIILRINSPGGTAAASQEIYREIIMRTKKPIITSIGDICASGAYYVASSTDWIIANESSSVGSIGVIMQFPNYQGLYEKLGIRTETFTKGKYKDIGSPTRELTYEERKLIDEKLQIVYEQFIRDVARGRDMTVEKVEELATGYVFVGSESLDLKLIDEFGNYQDAIRKAIELGEIKGKPSIIDFRKPTLFDTLLFGGIKILRELILTNNYLNFPNQMEGQIIR